MPYAQALEQFLAAKKPFISDAQYENYRLVGRRLGTAVGGEGATIQIGNRQFSHEMLARWGRFVQSNQSLKEPSTHRLGGLGVAVGFSLRVATAHHQLGLPHIRRGRRF